MLTMPQVGETWIMDAPERAEGWECPECGLAWGQNFHEFNGVEVTIVPARAKDVRCEEENAGCGRAFPYPEGIVTVRRLDGRTGALPYTFLRPKVTEEVTP